MSRALLYACMLRAVRCVSSLQVVITYVSYLCHQLLLLRKEGRAAVVVQRAWRSHRRLLEAGAERRKQQQASTIIQVCIVLRMFLPF